jgi:drug/metabolite transporter (DMT)-like permease
MLVSQLAFIFGDTFVKLAGDTLPMGEILFVRGCFCTVLVAAAVLAFGVHREFHRLRSRMVFWRMIGELGGTFFYILALLHIPIAQTTIIFQAVPLAATAGAALFLREVVGWHRWSAILLGFIGVLLVLRPGLTGFDAYASVVLISVAFIAFRDICTRAMPVDTPTLPLTALTAAAVTTMGGCIGLGESWILPSTAALLYLAAAAVFLAIGYFTVIVAMRLGELSATAPFRYVAVIFAVAIGFLVWGDVPDVLTIAGALIIVAAGIYTLCFESHRRRSGPAASSMSAASLPPTS